MDSELARWFNAHKNEILKCLSRHIVGLSWLDRLASPVKKSGSPDANLDIHLRQATMFIAEAEGVWLLLTAGHVLAQVAASIAPPRQLWKAHILDNLHKDEGEAKGVIPFGLDDAPRIIIDDEDLGLDYGAILLRRQYVELLAANGCSPVLGSPYRDATDAWELYAVSGFPGELRSMRRSSLGTEQRAQIRIVAPLIPVERVVDPPTFMEQKCERFCGRILSMEGTHQGERVTITDIEGMSGGPIFGIKRTQSGFEYCLVGIQSTWDEKELIAGCYAEPFMETLGQKIKAHGNASD